MAAICVGEAEEGGNWDFVQIRACMSVLADLVKPGPNKISLCVCVLAHMAFSNMEAQSKAEAREKNVLCLW